MPADPEPMVEYINPYFNLEGPFCRVDTAKFNWPQTQRRSALAGGLMLSVPWRPIETKFARLQEAVIRVASSASRLLVAVPAKARTGRGCSFICITVTARMTRRVGPALLSGRRCPGRRREGSCVGLLCKMDPSRHSGGERRARGSLRPLGPTCTGTAVIRRRRRRPRSAPDNAEPNRAANHPAAAPGAAAAAAAAPWDDFPLRLHHPPSRTAARPACARTMG
jgi:hypothetical protein